VLCRAQQQFCCQLCIAAVITCVLTLYTSLMCMLLLQVFAFPVYLSLLPVIGGVALASLKELSFSWMAFGNAMGSNTFSALRGIMGKKQVSSSDTRATAVIAVYIHTIQTHGAAQHW
jgi:Triose-phosphate Transporter family